MAGQRSQVTRSDRCKLPRQLADAGDACAGCCLIGAGDEALEPGLAVKRAQHWHRRHGRAVGIGDDALGDRSQRLGVHFGNHQRHIGVAAPGRAIVDDNRACRRRARGQRLRGRAAGRKEHDIEPGEIGLVGVFHGHAVQHRARRTLRGEEAQFCVREIPLRQQFAHHGADKAGRADDADARGIGSGKTIGHCKGLLVTGAATRRQFPGSRTAPRNRGAGAMFAVRTDANPHPPRKCGPVCE